MLLVLSLYAHALVLHNRIISEQRTTPITKARLVASLMTSTNEIPLTFAEYVAQRQNVSNLSGYSSAIAPTASTSSHRRKTAELRAKLTALQQEQDTLRETMEAAENDWYDEAVDPPQSTQFVPEPEEREWKVVDFEPQTDAYDEEEYTADPPQNGAFVPETPREWKVVDFQPAAPPQKLAFMPETPRDWKVVDFAQDGMPETYTASAEEPNLMQKVKDAGVAGIISYMFWELAFWGVSFPVCIFGYREVAGHWPDFANQDDLAQLGTEAFAFVNLARFAVPVRIGLALSTAPWVQSNVIDRFSAPGAVSEVATPIAPPSRPPGTGRSAPDILFNDVLGGQK